MKWIKCSDKLPKHYEPVLVVYKEYDDDLMIYSAILDEDENDSSKYAWIIFGYANHETKYIEKNLILYWMPFPDLPE